MKKLIAIAAIVIASVTSAQVNAQNKSFDVKVFQKELIKEMAIQFPGFKLDTTLNNVLRATSQEASGNSPVYVMKKGGNANIQRSEKEEAKRVVTEYKARLAERSFNDGNFKDLGFSEFSALVTKVNGSVRYALIIDNNITRESIEVNPEEIETLFRSYGFQVIEQ